jgi:prophage regulatory protein
VLANILFDLHIQKRETGNHIDPLQVTQDGIVTRSATLKITVLEQDDGVDMLPQWQMNKTQRELIKLVVRETIEEYIRETRGKSAAPDNTIESTVAAPGFMRLSQVLERIPVGKTCWWEGVKSGRFPKPVKLSARCTAWQAKDIQSLIKEIAEQGNKA